MTIFIIREILSIVQLLHILINIVKVKSIRVCSGCQSEASRPKSGCLVLTGPLPRVECFHLVLLSLLPLVQEPLIWTEGLHVVADVVSTHL